MAKARTTCLTCGEIYPCRGMLWGTHGYKAIASSASRLDRAAERRAERRALQAAEVTEDSAVRSEEILNGPWRNS